MLNASPTALVIECQQQALHDVGHVDERERVVTAADDDGPSGAETVGDPTEMQPIAGAKERAGSDDDGRQSLIGDHPLYQLVPFSFCDRIRLRERRHREILAAGHRQSHPIHRP